jgi:chromosome segregation ATPase
MNELKEHIISIENKLNLLLNNLKSVKKENEKLKKELEEKSNDLAAHKSKLEQMTLKLELAAVQPTSVSNENKASLERRINEYIKEIDRCIALLGDQD